MKAEIITIGDEILIGQIVDTNSAWLGQQLMPLGWEIGRITSISDTRDEIISAIEEASKRADLILMTGGLGPTNDDVTKSTLAEHYNSSLVFHQETYDNIERIFNHLNRTVSEVNRQQAFIPDQCEPLHNKFGTAPGMWFEREDYILVCMPGVPYEMKSIMREGVLPKLEHKRSDILEYKTIVVSGIPESIISEKISDVEANLPTGIKIAYLPNFHIVRLRITGRGTNHQAVLEGIDETIEKITAIVGDHIIANDDLTIQEIVGILLTEKKQTVSLAESCTGGYTAHLLTQISGSSAYFPGSVVTYSYDNKTEVLGVEPDLLWSEGAVSQKVVEKMARSVRQINQTDYGVAISGIAGPGGGTKDKPVGTVWMAVCNKDRVYSKLYNLRGDRIQNIQRSAALALELLRRMINGLI